MPMYELALPVSTTNPKITHNGVDYNLVESIFGTPAVASTRLEVYSSAAGDNTQNLVVYGIVAGVETSESFTLNGTTVVNGTKDFTEVFEAFLDATCAGTISIRDSTAVVLGTIAIGRRVLSPDIFKRVGKDGNEVILPLCGGDEFVGEVLEGQWKKDWDADIVTFTARINGVVTGMLEIGGESDSGGTLRSGWLNNHHPFVMMNEAELEVEMEIPTSDTGAAAGEDIFFEFYIRRQKELITPTSDADFIIVRFNIDENGLLMQLLKRVSPAAAVTLWDGSTADGNDGFDPAADKFWIFRFVFHDGHAGASSPSDDRHMHVYAKHATTRVGLDTATEEELFDTVGTQASPYNISDLLFTVGYPAYQIISAHETWFGSAVGSGNEAISTYLRTSYPALFALKYDFADASYGGGDVELWDMKGSAVEADWQQVLDEDHDFGGNDVVLQNGLIRMVIDPDSSSGLASYYWSGAAWIRFTISTLVRLSTDALLLTYLHFQSVESISPEKIVLNLKWTKAAIEDDAHYVITKLTMRRGRYHGELDLQDVFPNQDITFYTKVTPPASHGYVGDDKFGDWDLRTNGTNTIMTDNFTELFGIHTGSPILFYSTNKKPQGGSQSFSTLGGANLQYGNAAYADIPATIIYLGMTRFPLVVSLFLEAEDGTLGGAAAGYFTDPAPASTYLRAKSTNGADNQTLTIIGSVGGVRTTDTIVLAGLAWVNGSVDFDRVYILKLSAATLGNIAVQDSLGNPIHIIPAGTTLVSNAVLLTVQNDLVHYQFAAGTVLPAGRYLGFIRAYDTAHIADLETWVMNTTDGDYRNEENDDVILTPTASYIYYGLVFDITEADAANPDNIRLQAEKTLADANTIYVDYFLIIPICDGEDWPQDLAHAALRTFTKPRRLYTR